MTCLGGRVLLVQGHSLLQDFDLIRVGFECVPVEDRSTVSWLEVINSFFKTFNLNFLLMPSSCFCGVALSGMILKGVCGECVRWEAEFSVSLSGTTNFTFQQHRFGSEKMTAKGMNSLPSQSQTSSERSKGAHRDQLRPRGLDERGCLNCIFPTGLTRVLGPFLESQVSFFENLLPL